MIYITGDIHGDFSRFKSPLLRKLKKNDALIYAGISDLSGKAHRLNGRY